MEQGKKKAKLKIIIPIVIAIVVIAVVGIFLKNNKTDNSTNNVYVGDSTTAISIKDIKKAYNDNQAKFDKEYKGKKVKFTGTISKIETDILYNGSSVSTDIITFKEGWILKIPTGFCKKLSEINKGDKLEVSSIIQSGFYGIEVFDYGYRRKRKHQWFFYKIQWRRNLYC